MFYVCIFQLFLTFVSYNYTFVGKKSSHKIKFEPTLLLLGNRKYPGIYMCYIYITYVWICICYVCYICNVIILFLIWSLLVSFVWLFSTVRSQMCPQIACTRRDKVTFVALVWLFSTVRFQMSLQIACPRRGIVTLVAFV